MFGTSFIRDFATQCRIGCNDDERKAWQPIIINIVCETDMTAAIASDDRKDCIDYVTLQQTAHTLAQETTYHLLESLADAIARATLALPHALAVTVDIRKPHKLPGCAAVGITLLLRAVVK